MSRHRVPRKHDDVAIRHISEVLPRVLANYISRDELVETTKYKPQQLKLFDELVLSIGSSHQHGTVVG